MTAEANLTPGEAMNGREEAAESLRDLVEVLRLGKERLLVENPGAEIKCALVAYNQDETGQIGPDWDFEVFVEDLSELGGAVTEAPEKYDVKAEYPVKIGISRFHIEKLRTGEPVSLGNILLVPS